MNGMSLALASEYKYICSNLFDDRIVVDSVEHTDFFYLKSKRRIKVSLTE